MIFDTNWPRLFNIADGHRLELDSERQVERLGTQRCTRWFVEHDAGARIVARYRSWVDHQMAAPFSRQLGWERYSPKGALQVREVRYARGKRAGGDAGPWLN